MKVALVYAADGSVIGYVACTNDADLARQALPRLAEVAFDHPALEDPRGWVIEHGRPTKRPPGPPAEPGAQGGGR